MSSGAPVIDKPTGTYDQNALGDSIVILPSSPSFTGAMWLLGYPPTGAEIRVSGLDVPSMRTPPAIATSITASFGMGKTFRVLQSFLRSEFDTTIINWRVSLPSGVDRYARVSASELSATMLTLSERFPSIVTPPIPAEAEHVGRPSSRPQTARSFNSATSPAVAAASRLRQLSGLDAKTLGAIFGVTRTTYQNWLAGVSLPRGRRHRRLMEATALLEETAARLGNAQLVDAWLITPRSVSGQRPIDYLSGEKYTLYRGALLRAPGVERLLQPIRPTRHIRGTLSASELEDALQRLGPRAWQEEVTDSAVRDEPRSSLARRR